MKIYTRKGDAGKTSLLSGDRVRKDDLRVEAYGTVDELSSLLGLVRAESLAEDLDGQLVAVQETLFDVGAALADPTDRREHDSQSWDTGPIEEWIDLMDRDLDPLRSFILPGGSRASSFAHLARAVCRRAERRAVALDGTGSAVPQGVLAYLNRLSDALFTLARVINSRAGIPETEWRSGGLADPP
jgi:cob(I)alamin adenosyltransferase